MNKKILNHYNESLRAFDDIKKELSNIEKISKYFLNKINNNKKIFVYGNGGSFSDSSHFVGELTASYEKKNRRSMPFFLLSSNLAAVTAWSNDFKFEDYVKREFSGYVNKGDVLFLLSSSGGNIKNKQSTNLVKLAKCCKKKNIYLISLLGKGGGELKKYSNKYILVNSNNTGTIQEVHKMILHSICAYIDGTIK
jgi:phosphoheptose isomerase